MYSGYYGMDIMREMGRLDWFICEPVVVSIKPSYRTVEQHNAIIALNNNGKKNKHNRISNHGSK